MIIAGNKFYTTKDVSKILNISYQNLMNWQKSGIFQKPSVAIGKRFYYTEEEVKNLLEQYQK